MSLSVCLCNAQNTHTHTHTHTHAHTRIYTYWPTYPLSQTHCEFLRDYDGSPWHTLCNVTHTIESCPMYEQVTLTHMNESRHTCGRVTSNKWRRDITYRNESRHTYTRARHPHIQESRYTPRQVKSPMCVSHAQEACHTQRWVIYHVPPPPALESVAEKRRKRKRPRPRPREREREEKR